MFHKILRGIVDNCAGGVGAVLMGYDGIAIDQYFKSVDDVDLQLVTVEYANVLKEIHRTVEILNTGALEEVAIRTGRFFVVIRALTDDYFVALTLSRNGNFGKARYILTKEAPALRQALS
ncbi:MAG TPA: roadblock/LC7 domain-containing protein [Desulfuromonadales bacterium]|nr:roadblock/LC7 domain-containing protein [Desulfuromonadales bacterium]